MEITHGLQWAGISRNLPLVKKLIGIIFATAAKDLNGAGFCFPVSILIVGGGVLSEMIPGGQENTLLASLFIAFVLMSTSYLLLSTELWEDAEKGKKMRDRAEALRELEKRAAQERREMEQEEA
jgi:hypothetical protein